MNPMALAFMGISGLILFLLVTGKWDDVVDLATGHSPTPPSPVPTPGGEVSKGGKKK